MGLILPGKKIIETRTHSIPEYYVGKKMIVIETPGKSGNFKARMVGFIVFGDSFEYKSERAFYKDSDKHCVTIDSQWEWFDGVPKYGWPVASVEKWESPLPLQKRAGIKFSTGILL